MSGHRLGASARVKHTTVAELARNECRCFGVGRCSRDHVHTEEGQGDGDNA